MSIAVWFSAEMTSLENMMRAALGLLAVAGAAIVGALFFGLLAWVLCRVLIAKKPSPWITRSAALLGAIAAGWIVALLVFNSGNGWGFGGPGGGTGTGDGTGTDAKTTAPTGKARETSRKKPPRDTGKGAIPRSETLRIEVLGVGRNQGEKWYRIEGISGLLTLTEVRQAVEQRQKKKPPLQALVIVVYKDSPSLASAMVGGLEDLARDHSLTRSLEKPDRDSP